MLKLMLHQALSNMYRPHIVYIHFVRLPTMYRQGIVSSHRSYMHNLPDSHLYMHLFDLRLTIYPPHNLYKNFDRQAHTYPQHIVS